MILSEHIGRQGEGLCPVFQIVNLEGKLVLAPPLWVLAQLCLDFAVGLAVHQDVCICTGGSGGIHQTGALLNHREEIAIFVPHRLWARARSVMPSWDRPRSRMACFTRAVIPATWGAAMEVPLMSSY